MGKRASVIICGREYVWSHSSGSNTGLITLFRAIKSPIGHTHTIRPSSHHYTHLSDQFNSFAPTAAVSVKLDLCTYFTHTHTHTYTSQAISLASGSVFLTDFLIRNQRITTVAITHSVPFAYSR